jgi:TonB family protein
MAVHHIDMDDLRATPLGGGDIVTEVGKIGGEDGWQDLDHGWTPWGQVYQLVAWRGLAPNTTFVGFSSPSKLCYSKALLKVRMMNEPVNRSRGILSLFVLSFLLQLPAWSALLMNQVQTGVGDPPQTSAQPARPQGQGQTASSGIKPGDASVYRVGGEVTPPKVIEAPDPKYTDEARRKKISGVSVVEFILDVHGIPQDVHIAKSITNDLDPDLKEAGEGLDENAVYAVKKYRFEPSEYKGKPVPVRVRIEIKFEMLEDCPLCDFLHSLQPEG